MSLYKNIHAKKARIAAGSKEKMRKPGAKGAPTKAMKAGYMHGGATKKKTKGYAKGGKTGYANCGASMKATQSNSKK